MPVAAANAVGTGTATIAFCIAAAPSLPVITSSLTATGTVGSSFTYSIYTSGDYGGSSPTAYGASNLPPGLGFDPNSNTIKGTPTTVGTYSVPITAANAGGAGSAVVTISIAASTPTTTPQAAAPQLNSWAAAAGTVGTVLSYALTAGNMPTGFAASNLLPGLSLNPATGYLTGTPTNAGVYLVPVSASNAYGTSNGTLTIPVAAAATAGSTSLSPLVITSAAATVGAVGQGMTYVIGATSSVYYGYYFSYGSLTCTATNLPPGLSFNATYGTISGTPTAAGTYAVTVTAAPGTNYSYLGTKGTAVVTFAISASAPPATVPVFTSAAEVTATMGTALSGVSVFAASGSPTSYAATGLPPGLTITTNNGTVSGTPTTPGTYPVTVSATNSAGTGTATITYVVAQAAATVPLLTNSAFTLGTIGAPFSLGLTANVSVTSYTLGSLPPGLSFSTSNNYITGTPTAAGLYPVSVSAATASRTINATLTIEVLDPVTLPVIGSATTVRGTVGTSLTYTISAGAASNNPTTITAGTPPPGLTFSNGTISGTPTTVGVYQVPISATNGAGTTNATVTFTITAPVAPVFSGNAGTGGTVGTAFSYSIYAYNSPTSYAASNLPPGLSFSNAYFSGTPTTAGVYQVPISATNAGGTANATLTITIANAASAPPVVSSAAAAGEQSGRLSPTRSRRAIRPRASAWARACRRA